LRRWCGRGIRSKKIARRARIVLLTAGGLSVSAILRKAGAGKPRSCEKSRQRDHLLMTAFVLGEALPIPQKHDADERFAEDQYQHQVAPRHCKDAR
jgi:hypothetical protein